MELPNPWTHPDNVPAPVAPQPTPLIPPRQNQPPSPPPAYMSVTRADFAFLEFNVSTKFQRLHDNLHQVEQGLQAVQAEQAELRQVVQDIQVGQSKLRQAVQDIQAGQSELRQVVQDLRSESQQSKAVGAAAKPEDVPEEPQQTPGAEIAITPNVVQTANQAQPQEQQNEQQQPQQHPLEAAAAILTASAQAPDVSLIKKVILFLLAFLLHALARWFP